MTTIKEYWEKCIREREEGSRGRKGEARRGAQRKLVVQVVKHKDVAEQVALQGILYNKDSFYWWFL